jgi:tartronate-semialdehyde synthase
VPVVLEFILERVTNISMGTEINAVNEFEDIVCLDPKLTLENGFVSMAGQDEAKVSEPAE